MFRASTSGTPTSDAPSVPSVTSSVSLGATAPDRSAWHSRLDRCLSFDAAAAGHGELDAIAADLNALAGLVSSLRSACAGRRHDLAAEPSEPGGWSPSGDPEGDHGHRHRTTRRRSAQDLARDQTLRLFPRLRTSLLAGHLSVEHVDALTGLLRDLDDSQRRTVVDRTDEICSLAVDLLPDRFRIRVRELLHRWVVDDGLRRLQRQRTNTRLSAWVDQESGMVRVSGQFDPERGLPLLNRLQRAVDLLHVDRPSADCPDDPKLRHDHLRALALLQLVGSGDVSLSVDGSEPGALDASRVDMVVVVDLDTLVDGLHGHSTLDCGHGVQLPIDTLRRMACCAGIIPAVLNSDGVVLDLGRTVRLANRQQRRALRAMYPTCAIDGCERPFEVTKIHHVDWWEHGGSTDLGRMLPLCPIHHRCVHELGWRLDLDPVTRELTVTTADGVTTTTSPPRRRPPGRRRSRGRPPAEPPDPQDPRPG